MGQIIRFHATGGPQVLQLEHADPGDPGPGEVRIAQAAIGINFADIYVRQGIYPAPLPSPLGFEGAGVVAAVGSEVTGFAVGDRVAYAAGPLGAYAETRVIPAAHLLHLPPDIAFDTAAAATLRGLTAGYWLLKTNPWLKAGDTILLHAAAGGVGLIAVQWAKLLGLRVIGTVSNEAKGALARAHGADEIILHNREDIAARVRALTDGEGVSTVFDSIGKATYAASLASLKRRGVLVGGGTASGPFPPIDALELARAGSVYFTRPALADYIADPAEREELASTLFGHLAAGRIRVGINQRYGLAEAARAHAELEAGSTTGSLILVV